jgi:cytochrome c-type biogenesis protein CcmE
MKPKHRRLLVVVTGLACLLVVTFLVLSAMDEGIAFFYSPSDLAEKPTPPTQLIRIGGLVEEGSVENRADAVIAFSITDGASSIPVTYRGLLPDLFREGQGVVAMGRMDGQGGFGAEEVLAKHDENYIPAEVVEALKKSGNWQGSEQP